jgi:predicted acyl esterase
MTHSEKQILIDLNVPIEIKDGTVLRANIYRPNQKGKWPVLLSRTPYSKDVAPIHFGFYDISRVVQQGYVGLFRILEEELLQRGHGTPS